MPSPSPATPTDFTKLFPPFLTSAFPTDRVASAQRRNFEAVAAATQVAAESWLTIYRRQVEIVTQAAVEGAHEIQDLWSPGAADEKLAHQADAVKANFEKGIANLREVSDILAKANAEATDMLAKRVTESLTELKGAVEKKPPVTVTTAKASTPPA